MIFPQTYTSEEFAAQFQSPIWLDFAALVYRHHNISFENLKRAGNGENIIVFVDDKFVLKIYTPFKRGYKPEKTALELIAKKTNLLIPEIVFSGNFENFDYLILSQLEGF